MDPDRGACFITTGFTYDNTRGWVTAIDNQDGLLVSFYSKTYTRNARGQIVTARSNRANQEWTYVYDALDRLISADTCLLAQFPSRRMKPSGSKLRRLGDNTPMIPEGPELHLVDRRQPDLELGLGHLQLPRPHRRAPARADRGRRAELQLRRRRQHDHRPRGPHHRL